MGNEKRGSMSLAPFSTPLFQFPEMIDFPVSLGMQFVDSYRLAMIPCVSDFFLQKGRAQDVYEKQFPQCQTV